MGQQPDLWKLLENHTDQLLSWSYLASVAITCSIFLALLGNGHPTYPKYRKLGSGLMMPWLRWTVPTRWRLHEIEREGYEQFSKHDHPFVVNMYGVDALILPPKYLPALKTANRHDLSLAQALHDNLQMDATVGDIAIANELEIDLVSKNMNQKLRPICEILSDEADYVIPQELGQLPEYTEFAIMKLCGALIHRISNRVFVGRDLARNPRYTDASTQYMKSVFLGGVAWNFLPLGMFRKPFYWLASWKFRRDLRGASEFLVPVLQERMSKSCAKAYPPPVDIIQFALDQPMPSPQESNAYRHASRILQLGFASTGTTANLLYHVIWELLLHPEYKEPLRAEIESNLKTSNGWRDEKMLNGLHLMDSFIRETLRLNPPSCLLAQRVARTELELGDEMKLEKGSRIAFPTMSITQDSQNYVDSATFDGFRFAGPEHSNRSKKRVNAATVDEYFLPWGYGNQACPGRFYAIRLVKLVFGHLLFEYDLECAPEAKQKPAGMVVEGLFFADMDVKCKIRSQASHEVDGNKHE